MTDEFNLMESKAPFNMALNTLERLGGILTKIREISSEPFLNPAIKQEMKVSLTKQFFLQSSPLLSPEVVSTFEQQFLDFKPKELPIILKSSAGQVRTNDMKVIFDWELERKLDKFLLDVQRELQKEKYFMPPKKDLNAVMRF